MLRDAMDGGEAEIALAAAQAENRQLRLRIRTMEAALRGATKVLAPYR